MIGDLHCHTKFSDGSMNIDDVVFYAKRAGLDFVGITDCDTMVGLTRAGVLGKRLGIGIVPGVELSCFDPIRNREVHLLCYYPVHPDRLEGICSRTTELRQKAGEKMLRKVMEIYPITAESVQRYASGSKSLFKVHILHAIMDLGYCKSIYSDVYDQLFDSQNGSCYVTIQYPDVFEVAETIRSSGGICVLALPGVYDSYELAGELASRSLLDGIEYHYPRRTPEDLPKLEALVKKYGLIAIGGTDFHGHYTLEPQPLGTCITEEDQLAKLFHLRRQRSRE